MKIKTDFVTNSSSTCYVLSSIVSGHLPRLSGNYDKLKEFYGEELNFLYNGYGHITIKGDKEKAYEEAEAEYNLNIELNDTQYFDEIKGTEKSITIFKLNIDLLNPYWNEIEYVVKDVIETLLFKQLKENISPSQLMYLSFPSSISGDGWNGGDPQGPSHQHTYKYDLYKQKTKMGILNIMDSKVILEAKSIEESLNLNESLLDNINQQGLHLEEHNDKDS